jgi:hypothetical protein
MKQSDAVIHTKMAPLRRAISGPKAAISRGASNGLTFTSLKTF